MGSTSNFEDAILPHDKGVTLTVRVVPGAKKSEFAGIADGAVRVRIAAPPVDGKANQAVIELIAKAVGLRPKQLTLLRGDKSRTKQILIPGRTADDIGIALA